MNLPMYGKHFESMYTGSMRGKGAVAFAVLGYIVAHVKPPSFELELNPEVIGFLIGEPEDKIAKALEDFCSPDPKSRTPDHDGRKLIKRGMYLYFVVNGEAYHKIRSDEDKRSYWREQKRKGKSREGGEDDGEVKAAVNGSPRHSDREETVEIPEPLASSIQFMELWNDWNAHLVEKRKKPTSRAIKMQLEKLSAMGLDRAIAALKNSISGNYQGIFEPNATTGTSTKPLPKYGPHNPLPGSVPNNGF